MNHKVTINIADADGRGSTVLKGRGKKLPTQLLRFLFYEFTQVYLLFSGQTVQSVGISKVKEGGKK